MVAMRKALFILFFCDLNAQNLSSLFLLVCLQNQFFQFYFQNQFLAFSLYPFSFNRFKKPGFSESLPQFDAIGSYAAQLVPPWGSSDFMGPQGHVV